MMLDQLHVDEAVARLRPDFAALALLASGVRSGPSDADTEAWLQDAEASARAAAATPPHLAAWQEAFRGFGAKPQRTASSADALWQRARKSGLPRVNWLVDLYNAVSVRHVLPVGGEDADRFAGALRLVRATGREPFDTIKDGMAVVEHPDPGEVVWADDQGVTCRRWNWRQGTRTRLDAGTTRVLFLLEALDPYHLDALKAAGRVLVDRLCTHQPHVVVTERLLGPRFDRAGAR